MTEINRRNFLKGALAAGAMTAAVGMMGCSPKSGGEEKAAAASAVEDFVQTADEEVVVRNRARSYHGG